MADAFATTRLRFLASKISTTGPSITGFGSWPCMIIFLGVIVLFSREKVRKSQFWTILVFAPSFHRIIHQLASTRHVLYDQTWSSPFLLTQHGRCLWGELFSLWFIIILSRPEYNDQRYWFVRGVIWIVKRILHEVRSRRITYISKVIQHPLNVMGLQIKKEKTTTRAGQYIFLSCPEVSYLQWHPFTLTR